MDTTIEKIEEGLRLLSEARVEAQRLMGNTKRLIRDLPGDSDGLHALLVELADAKEYYDGHHSSGRFSREELRKPLGVQSQECQDDWRLCCNRRDKAIEKLTRFAIAMKVSTKDKAA